jgi:two-component system, cell cycle sensor histidine kinase and response regulator CckA
LSTQDPSERPPDRRSSEPRQANTALRESEERYRALFDSLDFIYLLDFEGRFLDANPAALELLGYGQEDIPTLSLPSLVNGDQLAEALEIMAELKETGVQQAPSEFRLRRKTGEYVDVETKSSVIFRDGQPYAVLGVGRDVTERREAEGLLRLMQYSVDQAPESVLWVAPHGGFLYVNEMECRSLGYSRDELLSLSVFDVTVGLSVATWPQRWDEIKAAQGITFENLRRRKDGTVFPVEITSRIIEYDGKELMCSFVHDITERKRADKALAASELRYRRLFEAARDGVLILDGTTGKVVDVNPFMEGLLGYTREEFIGTSLWELGPFRNALASKIKFEELQRTEYVRFEDLPLETKDGRLADVEFVSNVYEVDHEKVIQCNIRDISERKRAAEVLRASEERLRASQKMEAVGQLAGGIAHDFNNLLTAILGYSELLLAGSGLAHSGARGDVEEIRRAAERGAALTRQILAFSRRQTLRPDVVSLNQVLIGMDPLLRRTLGENLDLISLQQPDLGHVEVDVHQFEQVLMNLALNARDAMPAGGRLTLETANVELDENYSSAHPEVTPGHYVMLAVSDTGIGMDEATRAQVFEPFFTTKAQGQGTGLGLATVHGIVKQSGGSIFVYSEPGKGTTFKIYLPRVEERQTAEAAVLSKPAPNSGDETVIVVEDESSIRSLIERVLGGAGYQVISFATADEAVVALERGEVTADLLLTDVVLPGVLQGKDLVRRVQDSRPDLPFVYMSGYTRDAIVHAGRLDEGVSFLEKPFTPETLATMVRTTLDRPRGSG